MELKENQLSYYLHCLFLKNF